MTDHVDHNDECNCEQREEAKRKLLRAVEEFIGTVHQDSPMLLCASVVYETTSIDPEDGVQQYLFNHVMLGSSAMSTHVGMLRLSEKRLTDYMNRGTSG